jgi:alpha-ketoglutarate-dependent 2,4-dichlorophenoxyacetate dioxygenase
VGIQACPVTPTFVAEIGGVDLSQPLAAADEAAIKAAFWKYAVLIFPDQGLAPRQHLDFAQRFGPVETDRVLDQKVTPHRLDPSFADISNLAPDGTIWAKDSRQRAYKAGNRLWHTDSSFKYRPGLASMLYSRTVAPVGGHTEFADERAAYDALPQETKRRLEGLVAEHSIAESRRKSGFTEFNADESRRLPPVPQVMVRTIPESALPRVAHRARLRDSGSGGPCTGRGTHRARDAAPVRPHPSLAAARPRHVGQPLHDAPRHGLRRPALGARHAPHHRQRRRQHLRAGRHRHSGLMPAWITTFRHCS